MRNARMDAARGDRRHGCADHSHWRSLTEPLRRAQRVNELTDLTAVEAVAAMRRGDVQRKRTQTRCLRAPSSAKR